MSQQNANEEEDLSWLHAHVAQLAHERVQQTERLRQQREQQHKKMQRLADLKDRLDSLRRTRGLLAWLGLVGCTTMSIGALTLMAGYTNAQIVVTGAAITLGMGLLVLLCDVALWGTRRVLAREEGI